MAASPDAAAGQIFNQGLVPVEIKPVNAKAPGSSQSLNISFGKSKPSPKDMILFCRQMYTITRSGLPLLGGLTGLMQSTHNEGLREALVEVIAGLESGRTLSAAFRARPDVFS
ncbi:MAG: type II secretion system F family protein, partial [Pseudomonadota bacterium]